MSPWLPVTLTMIFVIFGQAAGVFPWWISDPALVAAGAYGGYLDRQAYREKKRRRLS